MVERRGVIRERDMMKGTKRPEARRKAYHKRDMRLYLEMSITRT